MRCRLFSRLLPFLRRLALRFFSLLSFLLRRVFLFLLLRRHGISKIIVEKRHHIRIIPNTVRLVGCQDNPAFVQQFLCFSAVYFKEKSCTTAESYRGDDIGVGVQCYS